MPTEHGERRRVSRWPPAATEPLSRVRLRAGRELTVVNVSVHGALVEGAMRLLPGTHVDVHVMGTQGRVLVRAKVVRCAVWALLADLVQYRGALSFDRAVEPLSWRPHPGAGVSPAV